MRRAAAKYLTMIAMIGGMAATASVTNCGGGSSTQPTTGKGGSTGSGGTGGTGGARDATGAGGTTGTVDSGTGGAGGTLNCQAALSPTTGDVTDFSDWSPNSGKWGFPLGLSGAKFSYAGAGSTIVRAEIEGVDGGSSTDLDFHVVATLTPPEAGGTYAGAGLSFASCVNVTAYTGLQFKVTGTLGGCAMEVQLQTFSQKPSTDNPAGGCTSASCYAFPKKTDLVPSETPNTVMFADLSPWAGATDAAQIVGIQWQFTVPPNDDGGQSACNVDVHIDDVKFVQ